MKTNNKEINKLFETNNHVWDNKIAFSIKDVSIMLDIPTSTLAKLCREGNIKTFKIGRHYRISRIDLYNYIEKQKDLSIIL